MTFTTDQLVVNSHILVFLELYMALLAAFGVIGGPLWPLDNFNNL